MLNRQFLTKICVVLVGIALQFQFTINISADSKGLRLNLCDALLPIIGIFILFSLLRQKSAWPNWNLKALPFWLIGLSALFIAATINGYIFTGTWSHWALFNKDIGWLVLLSYFLAASWFVRNYEEKYIRLFLLASFYTLLGITLINVICISSFHVFQNILNLPPLTAPWFAEGTADNKNTAALLISFAISFIYIFHFHNQRLFKSFVIYATSFFLPFFIFYNASKAFLILLLPATLYLAFMFKAKLIKPILLPFGIGLICLVGVISTNVTSQWIYFSTAKHMVFALDNADVISNYDEVENDLSTTDKRRLETFSIRIENIKRNFNHWKNAPLGGIGLGTGNYLQIQEWGEVRSVLDSTPSWILFEFGIIGFLIFLTFYALVLKSLWKGAQTTNSDFYRTLRHAVIGCLLCFACIALFHDILYTRFLWVLMGLGLAVPFKTRLQTQGSASAEV
jgi:hypothetical protein